ncbi:MAG: gluconate 2-dehydrogenase subunit 3 family protein [Flavobacteriaceae bacterium TMED220]|nr:MAG: gluconate 2-dehydrogenase subunit 3 family protein [Flavobacteriaceae bacterium TMED220]
MERRQALKNMGLSIGAFALTPSVAGLLQSCSGNSKLSWIPEFYSNEEADIITKTLEVILPPTPEIPGATDLNLAQFLDGYAKNVSGENERLHLKKLIKEYISTTLNSSGKTSVSSLSSDDIESRLAFYLKADKAKVENWQTGSSSDSLNYQFLTTLRSGGVRAFKMSEFIGENVMAYSPIPGRQVGCVDLLEATGGRAWSL